MYFERPQREANRRDSLENEWALALESDKAQNLAAAVVGGLHLKLEH